MANVSGNLSDRDHYDAYDYYEYEYDYDASVNNLPLEEFIPSVIVYSITLLVGVVGNSLVIFSIAYYGRQKNVTNVFLLSLASADLLLVTICVPIKFAAFFSFTWQYGEFMCKSVHYIQNVSMICSVWTLTTMSIERFIAIRYPLRAKYVCTITHARLVAVLVWVFSFVFAIPIIFGRIHKEVGVRHKAYWCIKEWHPPMFSILFEMYMFIMMFFVPICFMVVAYSFICVEVWKVAGMRASMRSGRVISSAPCQFRSNGVRWENHDATTPLTSHGIHKPKKTFSDDNVVRKQVVVMLMVVVLLFTVCWGPIMFNNLLTAFGVLGHHHIDWLRFMRMAFWLMAYVNSCVNPVVYAFMSKNFRQTFKYALCACVKGKAFVRAYRFSRSFNSTRTSVMQSNGRVVYPNDKISSDVSVTMAPRVATSSEYIELAKLTE
ncbi:allatostatin-A receptor-like [Haliotis rufescens]|uniref:allatostatin-A receptor-like n=1 Tax=Haliotis rufescens TaxID=6454 RepID=UPI001EB0034F|nr:allatostatin-A receptor-like [Haliotis rufescens]